MLRVPFPAVHPRVCRHSHVVDSDQFHHVFDVSDHVVDAGRAVAVGVEHPPDRRDADSQRWIVTGPVIDVDGQTPPCHWSSSTFGDTIPSCGTPTLDRLTELAASGAAGPLSLTYSQAQTHRTDRLSPQHQLKPGYWQPTEESSCAYWDIAARELKGGSEPGVGVVRVNGEEIPFDQIARIRLEHGDTLTIGTLSGGNNGATSCHWQWNAEPRLN